LDQYKEVLKANQQDLVTVKLVVDPKLEV